MPNFVSVDTNMFLKSKKIQFLLLGITSILCSRTLFFFFDDPEGPNLLIVVGTAAIIYGASFVVYRYSPSFMLGEGSKSFLYTAGIQMLVAGGLFLFLTYI